MEIGLALSSEEHAPAELVRMAQAAEQAGLGFADINLQRITDVRSRVPALSHRRPIPDAVAL